MPTLVQSFATENSSGEGTEEKPFSVYVRFITSEYDALLEENRRLRQELRDAEEHRRLHQELLETEEYSRLEQELQNGEEVEDVEQASSERYASKDSVSEETKVQQVTFRKTAEQILFEAEEFMQPDNTDDIAVTKQGSSSRLATGPAPVPKAASHLRRRPSFHMSLSMQSLTSVTSVVPGAVFEELQKADVASPSESSKTKRRGTVRAAPKEDSSSDSDNSDSPKAISPNLKLNVEPRAPETPGVEIKTIVEKLGDIDTGEDQTDMSHLIHGGRSHKYKLNWIMNQIWDFFEQPAARTSHRIFHTVYNLLIVLSACSPVAASTNISSLTRVTLVYVDMFFTVLFTAEIALKLVCCPRRLQFLKSMYTIIDLAVVIAGYINFVFLDSKNMFLELIATQVPIMRLLKLTRFSAGWRLLIFAMSKSVAPLLVPLYLMLLMVVFSGSLHFWIDKNFGCPADRQNCIQDVQPAFQSIPHAMWFVVVSVASVGYGDVVPNTYLGKVFASLQILAGVCYMAMPLSIIGANFSKVWDERHLLLVRDQLHDRLNFMTIAEIEKVFRSIDQDGSGELSFQEFVPFVESLKLNVSKRGIFDLFNAIDLNGDATISFHEFADFVFPEGEDHIQFIPSDGLESPATPCMPRGRRPSFSPNSVRISAVFARTGS